MHTENVETEMIFQSQSRGARSHFNVSARHRVGKILGIEIPEITKEKVGILDYLIAFIMLINYKMSTSSTGRKMILWTPRFIIKIYLYFFAGLKVL